MILDDFGAVQNTNYAKHLAKFIIIAVVFFYTYYYIGRNVSPGSTEMMILNWIVFVEFPVLITVFIRSFKGELKFIHKAGALIVLLAISYFLTFITNYYNFFNRSITYDNLHFGLKRTALIYLIIFLLSLPLIIFYKPKKIGQNNND